MNLSHLSTDKQWFELYIDLKETLKDERLAFSAVMTSRANYFRYCKDPSLHYEDRALPTPLEKTCSHITALGKNGHLDKAIAIGNKIFANVGCHVVRNNAHIPDKATTKEEMIDDTQMLVGKFHKAILNGDHPSVIKYIAAELHGEIDQTTASYDRDYLLGTINKDIEVEGAS